MGTSYLATGASHLATGASYLTTRRFLPSNKCLPPNLHRASVYKASCKASTELHAEPPYAELGAKPSAEPGAELGAEPGAEPP